MKSKKLLHDIKVTGCAFFILSLCGIILPDNILGTACLSFAALFGVYAVFSLILLIIVVPFELIGKLIGKTERRISQVDKSDFEKNKDYYREILEINSPLIIGYLDNLELDKKKIIAQILYMQKRKLININNGRLERLNIAEDIKLDFIEQEILKEIDSGKLIINSEFFIRLHEKVAYKAENLSLVVRKKKKRQKDNKNNSNNNNNNNRKTSYLIKWAIYYAVLFGVILNGGTLPSNLTRKILLCILLIPILEVILKFYGIETLINEYRRNKGKLYKRTAKGQELNKKLEGLKSYLKDYSLMDEREAKEIELWDDYLIYSVMFGQNKKIIEEYEKYLKLSEE